VVFFSWLIKTAYFHQFLFFLIRFDPIPLKFKTILGGHFCTKDILFLGDDVKALLGVELAARGVIFGLHL
jgi:hypothetical protein